MTNNFFLNSESQNMNTFISNYLSKKESFEVEIDPEKKRFVIEKIYDALYRDLKIVIIGDYDVDGVTATTQMKDFTESFSDALGLKGKVSCIIPPRSEHYGTDYDYFKYQCSQNDLIIVVDNGAHAQFFSKLDKKDMDKIIIADHHPYSYEGFVEHLNAINPNPKGDVKISTGLVIEMLFQYARAHYPEYAKKVRSDFLVDLTAISLIGDMADTTNPMVRAVITKGLEKINRRERTIYRKVFNDYDTVTVEDVAFSLNPKLNAPGRVGVDATFIVDALSQKDNNRKAFDLIDRLKDIDVIRKQMSTYYYDIANTKAKEYLSENPNTNILPILIPEAPVGINGLIAGMIQQKFNVDTVVVSRNVANDNMIIGSGRGNTIKMNFLEAVKDPEMSKAMFFGGHNAAIGLKVVTPKVFMDKMEAYNENKMTFNDAVTNRMLVSDSSMTLDEFKKTSLEYGEIVDGIPFPDKFFGLIDATVVGYEEFYEKGKDAEMNAISIKKPRVRLSLRDESGGTLSIIAIKNEGINHKSKDIQSLAIEIRPVIKKDSFDDTILADVIPGAEVNQDNKIKTNKNEDIEQEIQSPAKRLNMRKFIDSAYPTLDIEEIKDAIDTKAEKVLVAWNKHKDMKAQLNESQPVGSLTHLVEKRQMLEVDLVQKMGDLYQLMKKTQPVVGINIHTMASKMDNNMSIIRYLSVMDGIDGITDDMSKVKAVNISELLEIGVGKAKDRAEKDLKMQQMLQDSAPATLLSNNLEGTDADNTYDNGITDLRGL